MALHERSSVDRGCPACDLNVNACTCELGPVDVTPTRGRDPLLSSAERLLDDYAALEAESERLREALRGVLTGRVILDETENGDPILLDLSTNPATPVTL